jgi:hypothetical protein
MKHLRRLRTLDVVKTRKIRRAGLPQQIMISQAKEVID